MALDLNDKTANGNTLTNDGADEITTSLPFAAKSKAIGLVAANTDLLYAGDSASLDLSGDFTIEFWVKFTSMPVNIGDAFALVNKCDLYAPNNKEGYWISFEKGGGSVTRLVATINQTTDDTTRDLMRYNWAPTLDVWYHVAITCDISQASATTFEVFIDGTSVGNGTMAVSGNCASINNNNEPLRIGGMNNNAAIIYDANLQMADIRIWNDIRTPTEISDNKAVELVGNEANLVAYWPFESLGSPSASISLSPSVSISASPSTTQSVSISASPSISKSASPSVSISASPSISLSASPSLSPSASISLSPSASPSLGFSNYTRGDLAALPGNDNDLETTYTAQDETDVETKNNVRVGQTATSQYMIHQFKNFVGANTTCQVEWEGQTTMDPSVATVYLQIYNRNTTTWDTVDSDNTSPVDTDFQLIGTIADLTNYKDASNVISCRVQQLSTP